MRPCLRNLLLMNINNNLPKNYITQKGYTFQNFQDYSAWTAYSNGVKSQVEGGSNLLHNVGSYFTATLDKALSNLDLSTVETITIEFSVDNRTLINEVDVLLSTATAESSIGGARLMFQIPQADILNGLNRLTIHKDYALANGGTTWANVFKWVRCQVQNSSGTPNVVFRNITFNQKNKAIAVFQFDDFYSGFYTAYFQEFVNRGLVASFASQTSVIGNAGSMSSAQIQEMYNAGWEVVTHAHVHNNYTTLTDQQIRDDIASQRSILGNLGITKNIDFCHAYTNGARNASVISTLNSLGVKCARTSDNGLQSHENPNLMELRSISKSASTVVSNLTPYIDKVSKNGGLYFTYSHNDYQVEKLQQELDYIIGKGNIEFMTQGQWYKGLNR